jgi:hypothetical protein
MEDLIAFSFAFGVMALGIALFLWWKLAEVERQLDRLMVLEKARARKAFERAMALDLPIDEFQIPRVEVYDYELMAPELAKRASLAEQDDG